MRVLVACEFSGIVRDAFISQGHDAVSVDLMDTERPGPHIIGDVRDIRLSEYDLMIAHPPCTYLASSGARWWKYRQSEQRQAIDFFMWFVENGFHVIENPVGIMSSVYRKPDQIIHPWQYGHGETKATCLWLKDVPTLKPTNIVGGRSPVIHHMSPSQDRWKNRSRTYPGIAQAMATQWGTL